MNSLDETLTRLRALTARGDHEQLVAMLSRPGWPEESLQMIGDGLLSAARAGTDGAEAPARRCIADLRAREDRGDRDLADALDAALGGDAVELRPLPVDLEELAEILEGDPVYGGGRIDLRTGTVESQVVLDNDWFGDQDEDEDDPDRWLWVDCEGSREGYRDMVDFIDILEDPALAARLDRAISGRGAFRRFKDELSSSPELLTRFHAFTDDRKRGRARHWLAVEGYTPVGSG